MLKSKKTIYILGAIIFIILLASSIYIFKHINLQSVNKNDLNSEVVSNPTIGNENADNVIVEFLDYKCPYCKKYHNKISSPLYDKYIKNGKVKVKIVNAAILGDDSLIGSRAAHSINLYYPEKFLEFHNKMFELQPSHENTWITYNLIDEELDKLNIPKEKLKKIKKDYKTKGSKSWELAKKDQRIYEFFNNKYVPSIYVNGVFIKDPYSINNLIKHFN